MSSITNLKATVDDKQAQLAAIKKQVQLKAYEQAQAKVDAVNKAKAKAEAKAKADAEEFAAAVAARAKEVAEAKAEAERKQKAELEAKNKQLDAEIAASNAVLAALTKAGDALPMSDVEVKTEATPRVDKLPQTDKRGKKRARGESPTTSEEIKDVEAQAGPGDDETEDDDDDTKSKSKSKRKVKQPPVAVRKAQAAAAKAGRKARKAARKLKKAKRAGSANVDELKKKVEERAATAADLEAKADEVAKQNKLNNARKRQDREVHNTSIHRAKALAPEPLRHEDMQGLAVGVSDRGVKICVFTGKRLQSKDLCRVTESTTIMYAHFKHVLDKTISVETHSLAGGRVVSAYTLEYTPVSSSSSSSDYFLPEAKREREYEYNLRALGLSTDLMPLTFPIFTDQVGVLQADLTPSDLETVFTNVLFHGRVYHEIRVEWQTQKVRCLDKTTGNLEKIGSFKYILENRVCEAGTTDAKFREHYVDLELQFPQPLSYPDSLGRFKNNHFYLPVKHVREEKVTEYRKTRNEELPEPLQKLREKPLGVQYKEHTYNTWADACSVKWHKPKAQEEDDDDDCVDNRAQKKARSDADEQKSSTEDVDDDATDSEDEVEWVKTTFPVSAQEEKKADSQPAAPMAVEDRAEEKKQPQPEPPAVVMMEDVKTAPVEVKQEEKKEIEQPAVEVKVEAVAAAQKEPQALPVAADTTVKMSIEVANASQETILETPPQHDSPVLVSRTLKSLSSLPIAPETKVNEAVADEKAMEEDENTQSMTQAQDQDEDEKEDEDEKDKIDVNEPIVGGSAGSQDQVVHASQASSASSSSIALLSSARQADTKQQLEALLEGGNPMMMAFSASQDSTKPATSVAPPSSSQDVQMMMDKEEQLPRGRRSADQVMSDSCATVVVAPGVKTRTAAALSAMATRSGKRTIVYHDT